MDRPWFEWQWMDDPQPERVWAWDVQVAQALTAQNPIFALYLADLPEDATSAVEIDETYALSDAVDLTRPLMLVQLPERAPSGEAVLVIIDGYHRLYKARRTNADVLTCVFLSAEQERAARLDPDVATILRAQPGYSAPQAS